MGSIAVRGNPVACGLALFFFFAMACCLPDGDDGVTSQLSLLAMSSDILYAYSKFNETLTT